MDCAPRLSSLEVDAVVLGRHQPAGAPHEGCRSAGPEPVSQALGCTLRLSQHAAPRGVPRATVQPGLTKTDRDLRLSPMDRHQPVGAPRSAG
jgi:hypothetical protein